MPRARREIAGHERFVRLLLDLMRQWIADHEWHARHWHTKTSSRYASAMPAYFETRMCKRSEPNMLSGEAWKRSMRSAFSWFAEFCHSQRLSHFAASFIVVRAETSIAKSCEKLFVSDDFEIRKRLEWRRAEAPQHKVARGCVVIV